MIGTRGARRPLQIGSRLTGSAAIAGGVLAFVLDLTANQLGTLGQWVPWTIMVCGAPAAIAMWALEHREPPVPELVERRSLTDRSPLIGREDVIADTMHKARSHRCVLMRGPGGVGTSAVAIEVLRRLVSDPGRRHWVDAYGQDEREVRLNVLRTLDLPVAHVGGAVELAESRLRHSGEALLIDNVTDPAQVRWIARPIPLAYVIIAGDLGPGALRGVAETTVGGLEPDEGLRLFCNPYGLAPPPKTRLHRPWPAQAPRLWRRVLRGLSGRPQDRPPNTIEQRVAAEPGPAAELARHYLLRPRIVRELGRIFDANPDLSVSDLLGLLRRGEESGLSDRLRALFRSLLTGVPKEGRRLLALMALLPDAAYEADALAALSRWGVPRTEACLADLAARSLVHRGPGGTRVAEQARTLDLPFGRRRGARARRRLYAYYAELAAEHADALGAERHAEARVWFASADAVLKRLAQEEKPKNEIIQIADALEVWYAQEGRAPEREAVARTLAALDTEPSASVGHLRLAAIARTRGDLDTATRHLNEADPLTRARGLAQWRTESALQNIGRNDLPAARADIETCLAVRPPGDLHGRIGDEINLGVIAALESAEPYTAERAGSTEPAGPAEREEHRARSLERARYHFVQALDLAETIGEISGQAHAHEMIGVVLARQENLPAAVGEWRIAGELWLRIGDEAGRGRCDRHRDTGA